MKPVKDTIFQDFVLNKDSRLPYYYQVYIYILKKINIGEVKIDDRLPSENRLSRIFNVSVITVRRALNELEENGIVSRIRGSGTYVKNKSEKTFETEIKTLLDTANKADKEVLLDKELKIADFMSGKAGRIGAKNWKPVLRPSFEKYTVAYSSFGRGLWWYQDLVDKSIIDALSFVGCDAFILDNKIDKKEAINNTNIVINKFKNNKIDFFINAQMHSEINDQISEMLKEAEVPTCGVDVYIKDFPFFHADNYKLGFIAGEWLGNYSQKNNWPEKETVFIYLDQIASGQSVADRKRGAIDGINSFIDIEENNFYILESSIGSIEESKKQIFGWLNSNKAPDFLLITGATNFSALGAAEALKEFNEKKETVICSIFGTKEDFQEIVDEGSPYQAAICTFPEKYGSILIPFAIDYLEGNSVPSDFVGYSAVVTIDNLDRFYPEFLLK